MQNIKTAMLATTGLSAIGLIMHFDRLGHAKIAGAETTGARQVVDLSELERKAFLSAIEDATVADIDTLAPEQKGHLNASVTASIYRLGDDLFGHPSYHKFVMKLGMSRVSDPKPGNGFDVVAPQPPRQQQPGRGIGIGAVS